MRRDVVSEEESKDKVSAAKLYILLMSVPTVVMAALAIWFVVESRKWEQAATVESKAFQRLTARIKNPENKQYFGVVEDEGEQQKEIVGLVSRQWRNIVGETVPGINYNARTRRVTVHSRGGVEWARLVRFMYVLERTVPGLVVRELSAAKIEYDTENGGSGTVSSPRLVLLLTGGR